MPPIDLGQDKISASMAIAKMEISAAARFAISQVGQDIPHHSLLISNCVYFSGLPIGARHLITAYGHPVLLTLNSFVIFFRLNLQSYLYDFFPLAGYTTPWLILDHLFAVELHNKYVHRLRKEIQQAGIVSVELIATNLRRGYRSLLPTSSLIFDLKRLSIFEDARVSDPAQKLLDLTSIPGDTKL